MPFAGGCCVREAMREKCLWWVRQVAGVVTERQWRGRWQATRDGERGKEEETAQEGLAAQGVLGY